jgi:hypothetical protein
MEYQHQIPEETRTRRGESLFVLDLDWFWYLSPLPIGPCGCAEERRARRIRAKTCLSRRRVVFDPGWTEHHRLPVAQRRDAGARVAFSLVTFFWRSKRKLLAAGNPGPGTQNNSALEIDKGLRQAQPERKRKRKRRTENGERRTEFAINSEAKTQYTTWARDQKHQ